MLKLVMNKENKIKNTEGGMEAIKMLAKDYATYSNKNTKQIPYGNKCEDITPKGKKAARTRKYNKFADACEKAGLTLKEQNGILRKYY